MCQTSDLLVYIQVWTPEKLSKEEKAAFEKLRGSSNLSPKPAKTDKNFFDRLKKMFS